ncbi:MULTISPECIES: GNAT family N-acetyltransferase [Nostocales]|uniref:GNAT family N-acetyltransferase n=3 Tax=Nostocales TaxID=1161 RepID=A0A0C1R7V5_9CYAN|nr:GNAT family N-acetyltransferase [Tolypothrix bouteillei]KAF3884347.1 GNAT family N-acetyltransferase [Tolypothrix bouteillei VB521301]
MKLISYSYEFQASLEEFSEIMYSSRGYKFDPTGLHSDIRNIENIYQTPGGNFWIMIENSAVIGSIGLKILNKVDKIGEIKRYFVLPSCQGKGIGTLLMEHLLLNAKENELYILRLDAMKKSIAARKIFEKYGFQEINKYNENEIAEIFMELKLKN